MSTSLAEEVALLNEQLSVDVDWSAVEQEIASATVEVEFPGQDEDPDAGKMVTLYNPVTGLPSQMEKYIALKLLTFKNRDGSRMWTSNNAGLPKPPVGKIKCMLHPQSPEFAETREFGITTVCGQIAGQPPRANLQSEGDLLTHMERIHKREWKMLNDGRARRSEAEHREFQRVQMEWMRSQTRPAPFECEVCGEVEKTAGALAKHQKTAHPEAAA